MLAAVVSPFVFAQTISDSQTTTQTYSYKIIRSYPHARDAFTQGLTIDSGLLYESTGLYGHSQLQIRDLSKQKVIRSRKLKKRYFAEGIAIVGDKVIQLSYKSNKAFVYNKKTLKVIDSFSYPGEGWGLTYDGTHLIMSNGSEYLYFIDPNDYQIHHKIEVTEAGHFIKNINELEFINGEIFANIWHSNRIIGINPKTGQVQSEILLDELAAQYAKDKRVGVLNGIAYDAENDRMFVTGKFWPALFEIKLIRESAVKKY